jgi:hypothetical protein
MMMTTNGEGWTRNNSCERERCDELDVSERESGAMNAGGPYRIFFHKKIARGQEVLADGSISLSAICEPFSQLLRNRCKDCDS